MGTPDRFRLTLVSFLMFLACSALQPAGAADWPEAPWSPTMAMNVKLSAIQLDHLNLLSVLQVLANDCGLVFGDINITRGNGPDGPISLDMHDVTLRQVIDELRRQSPDYVFRIIDDVVEVAPKQGEHDPARLLDEMAPAFAVKNATRPEIGHALWAAVRSVQGIPPNLEDETWDRTAGGWPIGGPRFTLSLRPLPMGELLAKVSAVTGDWWFLNLWDDRNPFFDTVGGRIWLWKGEEEKFKIVPAPDAPRKPRRGPPATDAIAAQVRRAIEKVRGTHEHADAAVQALCDLIEDPYVRDAVPAEVREGIQLLCELRPVRAVPDLVDHIALATGGGQDEYPTWIDGLYTQYDFRKVPNGMKMAYDQWLLCFPCVGALAKIGQPSVGPLIEAIGTTDLVVPASYPDPRAQASRLQCKAVLLCETLVRILGADAAIARLREAATAEKDAAKSTRLRDAADRITRGLPPPPP